MSTMSRKTPSQRRSRRRKHLLGAILGVLAGLTGCGQAYDPFQTYDDGAQVQAVGVVHFQATTDGDFLPGRLVGELTGTLSEAGVENVRDSALPGSNVIFNSETPSVVRFDLPVGMSLAEGAARLETTGLFSSASPEFLSGTNSAPATLRSSAPGAMLKDQPVVATLVAEDLDMLRQVQGSQVVRVTARTRESLGEFAPGDVLLAEGVEALMPYALQLTGHVTLVGSNNDCLLLNLSDGRRIELTGTQAILLAQNSGVDKGYTIRGADLGLSTSACSGGPQMMVLEFTVVE